MNKYFTISIILYLSSVLAYSQVDSTNGTGGGNWTTGGTWKDGTAPSSGKVVVKAGDLLTVNGNFSVDTIVFLFKSTGTNRIFVTSGRTLTCAKLRMEPVEDDAFADLDITGTLSISNGASNRNLDISGNPSFDNLDIDINVNSGGQLLISDQFIFDSQSSSTDLNLTTVGKFQSQAFTADVDAQDCNFILDINGDFDYTAMIVAVSQDNSDIDIHLRSSADVDATGATLISSTDVNNSSTVLIDNGGSWNSTSTFTINYNGNADNNDMNFTNNGIFGCTRLIQTSSGDNSVFTINIGSTGTITTTQRYQIVHSAGATTGSSIILTVSSGGTVNVGAFFEVETTVNGSFDFNINGTVTVTTDFRNVFRTNTTGAFDVSSTGSFTANGIEFDYRSNGDLTFNNSGTFTSTGVLNALALSNDVLTFNYNSATSITGNYRQRTFGSGSTITSHVFNSLTMARLELDVQTGASNSNNVMNVNHPSAVLNLNAIDFLTGSGTLTAGTINNSIVNFKGSTSGDSIPLRSTISYDNLTISNTAGIQLLDVLNNDFVNGDILIASGGSLTVNGSGAVDAPHDFTNNFVYQNNSSNDFICRGNFSNSGTFGNSGGRDFFFYGNLNNTGTFQYQAGDTVYFVGTSTQFITGTTTMHDVVAANDVTISSGMLSVERSVTVTNSSVLNANGKLTLVSDASGTAFVKELTTGNSISGNVRVQRFLNEGAGYHMMASPVTNATLGDWQNGIWTGGYPGSSNPVAGVSVYTYNESLPARLTNYANGYVAATDSSNALTNTRGFMVYVVSTPATVEVVGTLRQGNNIGTGILSHTVGSVGTAEDGWHLRANPYASPVLWSAVTFQNINNNEGYVRRADVGGNYWAISGDNIDTLYSGEAVWVQTSTSGVTKQLIFNENDKVSAVDNYNTRLKSQPSFTLPLKMELSYNLSSNYSDYSVLRFGSDSNSVNWDNLLGEARKIGSSVGTYPNVATWSYGDSSNVYYNGLNPNDSTFTIPLNVWTGYPTNNVRTYKLEFNGIKDWVENGHCLILRDTVANISQKLDEANPDYSWSMNEMFKGLRLFLDHEIPVTFEKLDDASCYGYNDGAASVKALTGGSHTYIWKNAQGSTVFSETTSNGFSTFNGLESGKYIVWVDNNGVCGDMAVTIEIGQPEPVIADFTSDEDTIYMNTNSTIVFTNASVNATDYFWDFGDGNTSNQVSPSHTYASGGSYNVSMAAVDDLCGDTISKTMVVVDNVGVKDVATSEMENIRVYQQQGQTIADLKFEDKTNVTIQMIDILGKSIIRPLNYSDVTERKVIIDVPENLNGIYFITVTTTNQKQSFKLYYE